jgi:RNA polymerase sigma-70 factor (ECF subfamily)
MSEQELIRACAEVDDNAAWEEFVSRYKRPISLSILRIAREWGQTPAEILDDLIQETFLKLYADKCRLLLQFTIQHPEAAVVGYIKTIAINLTHDYFRSLFADKQGGGQVQQLDPELEPRTKPVDSRKVIEQPVLLGEIDRYLIHACSGSHKDRDLLIFRLHYWQGMSASAIAGVSGIILSAKGVETAIYRLTRLVREHIVGTRSDRTANSEPEKKDFDSENPFD